MKELEKKLPLVSVCVPNYNYAQYLKQCLDSIEAQTYPNIEVLINDNASTDNSWEIAADFKRRIGDKYYCYLGNNRINVGSDANCVSLMNRAVGKYMVFLSSDDYWESEFLSKTVSMAEEYELVMVMAERNEVDENGNITKIPPFFNRSFFCGGEDMASVFMMSGIGIPSQCLLKRSAKFNSLRFINYSLSVAGDWMANFALACTGPIGYIKDALVNYRVHTGNETSESEKNLTATMEHFLLINAFCRMADNAGYAKPQKRRREAEAKLGTMALRYAHKMLLNDEPEIARKYLGLAKILNPVAERNELYEKLSNCSALPPENRLSELNKMSGSSYIKRKVSYDPPENYVEVKI